MRRGKTKIAIVKWYNLCLQIIQSQSYYLSPNLFAGLKSYENYTCVNILE